MSTNERPSEHIAEERPDETSRHHEHHANHEHGEHHEYHEHRHSHHSHRSHHHRRKRKNKRKRSFKDSLPKFMRNKQFWINISILFIALILLAATGLMANEKQKETAAIQTQTQTGDRPTKGFDGTVSVSVPLFREDVSLVGEAVHALTAVSGEVPAHQVLDEYHEGDARLDEGLPVVLSYSISGLPTDCTVERATVEVAENEHFANARLFELEKGYERVSVYHLKTGTKYFYRISVYLSDGTKSVTQSSFTTAKSPRILSIDGAINVRDIGGWSTVEGKTVRQGLVYRGGELDGAIEPDFCLTARGLEDMLTVLDIRTEVDLRPHTDNKFGVDALGADVEHLYIGLPGYEGVFTEEGKAAVRNVFTTLAKEENYPVYIHCTYGMDRTGTICYLLEALLGMSEGDMLREYRLSALYHGGVPQENLTPFIEGLNAFAGDTVQEKTENYLRSAGISDAEMETIKQILLEQ